MVSASKLIKASYDAGKSFFRPPMVQTVATPAPVAVMVPIRSLGPAHAERIAAHLRALSPADRYLRFGYAASDELIDRYVASLNFARDDIFGIYNRRLQLIAMAHLAYLPETKGQTRAAEFGVSVLPKGRSQGLGTALLERSAVHSRNTRIETLYVHCLASNKAMMHLAQKAGMRVEFAYGDADAYLKLSRASPATIVEEAANEQWADLDYAMKSNLKKSKQVWGWFLGRPKLAR